MTQKNRQKFEFFFIFISNFLLLTFITGVQWKNHSGTGTHCRPILYHFNFLPHFWNNPIYVKMVLVFTGQESFHAWTMRQSQVKYNFLLNHITYTYTLHTWCSKNWTRYTFAVRKTYISLKNFSKPISDLISDMTFNMK